MEAVLVSEEEGGEDRLEVDETVIEEKIIV